MCRKVEVEDKELETAATEERIKHQGLQKQQASDMISGEMVVEVRKVKELIASSDEESRVTQVKKGQILVIQLLEMIQLELGC